MRHKMIRLELDYIPELGQTIYMGNSQWLYVGARYFIYIEDVKKL